LVIHYSKTMRPYGERKKINSNIPDVHPKKGYTMWWKAEWDDVVKGRARKANKVNINIELDGEND